MEKFSFDHPFLSRRLHHKPHPISKGEPLRLIPDELFWEILKWVPVKSLMRFKCVSKIWRSIITDPAFAKAYRGGFRGLLLSEPICRLATERNFFYASFEKRPNNLFSHHLTIDHGGKVMGHTEIVNGLLCFYYREYSYLYNLATRERLQLPLSAAGDISKSKACSYHFGYDPVNKLYKVLKICPVYVIFQDDDHDFEYTNAVFVRNLHCEILTISVDSSWRIIHSLPPIEIMSRSVCIDGVLYWQEPDRKRVTVHYNCLVAFNLLEETFRLIPTPREDTSFNLPLFAPSLTLIARTGGDAVHRLKIYRYCDGTWVNDEQNMFMCLRSHPNDTLQEGILPNGKVLMTDTHSSFSCPLFLYDPTKKKLEKIELHLHPASSSIVHFDDYIPSNSYYIQENIISLGHLTSKSSGSSFN